MSFSHSPSYLKCDGPRTADLPSSIPASPESVMRSPSYSTWRSSRTVHLMSGGLVLARLYQLQAVLESMHPCYRLQDSVGVLGRHGVELADVAAAVVYGPEVGIELVYGRMEPLIGQHYGFFVRRLGAEDEGRVFGAVELPEAVVQVLRVAESQITSSMHSVGTHMVFLLLSQPLHPRHIHHGSFFQ